MRHAGTSTGSKTRAHPSLDDLRAATEDLLQKTIHHATSPVPTGWLHLDTALAPGPGRAGGLARAAIHEWFVDAGLGRERRASPAPLGILAHLARRATPQDGPAPRAALWIGRRCWPYPPLLARLGPPGASLLHHSIFIDAHERAERVWAIEIALRCPAVAVVVGDAAGLSMAESRRLQLAASAGGALGLIVKPLREIGEISAAQTRWLVRSQPSDTREPGWLVELLRCKGVRPMSEGARRIAVRWRHETRDVGLVPDALDRPAQETRSPLRIRQAV